MMSYLFFMIFMTPIFMFFDCWLTYQFFLLMLMVMFLFNYSSTYFMMISYFFGMDFISYGLVILSVFISSLMMLSSFYLFNSTYCKFYLILNFLLLFSLIIVFCSMNMFIMYVFFEFSLIPLLLMIFGWGYQPERLLSGMYLFFYTLFASLPLLVMIIYFYMYFGSVFFDLSFGSSTNFFFHLSIIMSFLVKFPMFMFHFWLPKAHVQAPVSGSMILAGLLLKIGGYGIIRFMFIYESLFISYSYIWYSFCIFGSLVVSLICLLQGDVKCLIAYSSIAHMGMCLMGILTMTKLGLYGSYLMMLGHGLCSSGLFCLASISYDRLKSRSFYINKGLLVFMPSMSLMWFMLCIFNMGCPPSINFISEIMILMSMLMYWSNSFLFIFMISFFSACFSFYLFSFTQHGKYHNLYCYSYGNVREYLLLFMHIIPLIFILLMIDFFLL